MRPKLKLLLNKCKNSKLTKKKLLNNTSIPMVKALPRNSQTCWASWSSNTERPLFPNGKLMLTHGSTSLWTLTVIRTALQTASTSPTLQAMFWALTKSAWNPAVASGCSKTTPKVPKKPSKTCRPREKPPSKTWARLLRTSQITSNPTWRSSMRPDRLWLLTSMRDSKTLPSTNLGAMPPVWMTAPTRNSLASWLCPSASSTATAQAPSLKSNPLSTTMPPCCSTATTTSKHGNTSCRTRTNIESEWWF